MGHVAFFMAPLGLVSILPVGNSPQEFGAYMKSEIAKWAKVIRAAGIKAN